MRANRQGPPHGRHFLRDHKPRGLSGMLALFRSKKLMKKASFKLTNKYIFNLYLRIKFFQL